MIRKRACIFYAALLLFVWSAARAQTPIQVAAQEGDERFFPLLTDIYREMGFDAQITVLPSARALSATNAGQFDAEVGRIPDISPRYPDLAYTQEPLLKVQLVAVALKGKPIDIQSKVDLAKLKVGYLNGMSVSEHYVRTESLTASSVASHEQLAKMLKMGRLDVILMGTAFKQSPVFSIGEIKWVIDEFNVFHVFHKRNRNLIPLFDTQLKRAKQDGRYEKLLARPSSRQVHENATR